MKLHRCLGPNPGMHMYDCRHGEQIQKHKTDVSQAEVQVLRQRRYLLFIEGTAAAGGGAVFEEGLCELLVEVVCHGPWDSLPCQDEDNQHSSVTVVPWPLTDQTQQLLLLTATPDHLPEDLAHS